MRRTWLLQLAMSALSPKADIAGRHLDVRFVPKADIAALLNHLVGGNEQVGRYIKAKCLGGLEIDSRLEPCRSLNW
jgi:hypothetical protein